MSQIVLPEELISTEQMHPGAKAAPATAINIFKLLVNVIRFFTGLALLGVGALLLNYVISEVYNAYQHIDSNVFVATLIEWLQNEAVILNNQEEATWLLGKSGAVIVALLFGGFIALICVRIALMFFTTGIKVLGMRFNG